MEVEKDPISGRKTTGHIWNGIKELDTPVPRGVLIFLVVTHIFAIVGWLLWPAWPLGTTYTKGLLDINQRKSVEMRLRESQATRATWLKQIEAGSVSKIEADPKLMSIVQSTGHRLFGDNCAACHGVDGKGGKNYPDLTDDDWIWGGSVEQISETMRIGVNAEHPKARVSQMPSFGRDRILNGDQVELAARYVYSLSHPGFVTPQNRSSISSGREVFRANCAVCHGDNARGNQSVGAPNLTDAHWLYGGNLEQIVETVHGGRQGHMPTWDERLTDAQIKILALYVHALKSPSR